MRITDIKCYVLERTAGPRGYFWRDGLNDFGFCVGTPKCQKTYNALLKV